MGGTGQNRPQGKGHGDVPVPEVILEEPEANQDEKRPEQSLVEASGSRQIMIGEEPGHRDAEQRQQASSHRMNRLNQFFAAGKAGLKFSLGQRQCIWNNWLFHIRPPILER
ncbi:hypothetical protein DSECCO2_647710 [anaerobic digester metagenome]